MSEETSCRNPPIGTDEDRRKDENTDSPNTPGGSRANREIFGER